MIKEFMNIEKHIVVKEIGNLAYKDLSPIYKSNSKYILDADGYCADDMVFDKPLEVDWKYSEISIIDEDVVVKKLEIKYDFGMPYEFFPEQTIIENPLYWEYRNVNLNSSMTDIVKRFVEDELIFSFRRNPAELKTQHWALKGWLKDRVVFPWKN